MPGLEDFPGYDGRPVAVDDAALLLPMYEAHDLATVGTVDITLADGKKQTVVTDTSWQATAKQLPRGWQLFDYQPKGDDGWKKPISHGKYGMQPWGEVATVKAAQATPAEQLVVPAGFKAELMYSVPKLSEGSSSARKRT